MTRPFTHILGGLLVAALLVPTVSAQPNGKRNGTVHRMEIYNGLNRTVRYHGDNVSPGETLTLREMERIENETDYVQNLTALKQQYVTGERLSETHRRYVQRLLYGVETSDSRYAELGGGGGWGYGGNRFAPYVNPFYSLAGYGYGTGFSGVVGGTHTVAGTLADGVGDEGRIKTAMAPVLAQQANPEYATSLDRAYDRVVLRASTSPTLRVALGLPSVKDSLRERSDIRQAANESTGDAPYVLTLKDGEKLNATKIEEGNGWISAQLVSGGAVRIREAEVLRIDVSKGNRIRPAIND